MLPLEIALRLRHFVLKAPSPAVSSCGNVALSGIGTRMLKAPRSAKGRLMNVPKEAPKAAIRVETDSFGPIEVAADRYWGAQTQRSLENFRIGGERMPKPIVRALGIVKMAAAMVNKEMKLIDGKLADAI